MGYQLSTGAIPAILRGETGQTFILQCTGARRAGARGAAGAPRRAATATLCSRSGTGRLRAVLLGPVLCSGRSVRHPPMPGRPQQPPCLAHGPCHVRLRTPRLARRQSPPSSHPTPPAPLPTPAGLKKMQNAQQPGQERYRMLLSDGTHQYSCMLATQLAGDVHRWVGVGGVGGGPQLGVCLGGTGGWKAQLCGLQARLGGAAVGHGTRVVTGVGRGRGGG